MANTFIDIGKIVPVFTGDYSPSRVYEFNDLVRSNNIIYWHVERDSTVGVQPPAEGVWMKLLTSGGEGGGSNVAVDAIQTEGTHIADITVDGEVIALYAPEGAMGEPVTVSETATGDILIKGQGGISGGGGSYTLPPATSDALGGVKADPKQASDTQAVRIGQDGKLYVGDSMETLDRINEDTGMTFENLADAIIYAITRKSKYAFLADFSGAHPLATQFGDWNGRAYGNWHFNSVNDVECVDGVAQLKTYHNGTNWVCNSINTAEIFEADDYTLEFDLKLDPNVGAWGAVCGYGQGTYWGDKLYSQGIPWAVGGEIDFVEQGFGGGSPTIFKVNTYVKKGTEDAFGTNQIAQHSETIPVDSEWHSYRIVCKDNTFKAYMDGAEIANFTRDNEVTSPLVYKYKPFRKPMAFYIGGEGVNATTGDTSKTYIMYCRNFKVTTDAIIQPTAMALVPQIYDGRSGGIRALKIQERLFLTPKFTPTNTTNKAVTWSSTNTSVATVSHGVVYGVSAGNCDINATSVADNSVVGRYSLTVSTTGDADTVGLFTSTNAMELMVGETATFAVTKLPTWSNSQVVYTTTNDTIATIVNGVATGVGEGECTITATCNGETVSTTVNVSSGIIFDEDVRIATQDQHFLTDGITYDFTKTYSFQYTFGTNDVLRDDISSNVRIGPAKGTNYFARNGGIFYLTASQTWKYYISSNEFEFVPHNGSVLTMVANFATNRMDVYLDGVVLKSQQRIYTDYFVDSTELYYQVASKNIAIAPTHIKIALGDLH